MKKLSALAVILFTIIACNKDTKTVTKTDPKTGKTIQVEVPANEATPLAIADSAGIYKQKFLLEKGHTYPFTTYQKDAVNVTAPDGKKHSVTTESQDDVTFTVNDLVNGVYDITVNFVNKKTSQSGDGKSATVDTRTAAPKETGLKNRWTVDKALTGNQLKMKMDQNGKIISITGFDPIYTKVSAAIAKIVPNAEAKKELTEQTKQSFNEKVLKDQFTKNILVLPAKGARIGEKWSTSEPASADGKVKLTTNYTLKSANNGVVEIAVSGGIPTQADKQTQQGVTHSISSTLSQKGTVKFDQKTGWLQTQDITVNATQKESMSDGKKSQSMSSVTVTHIVVNPASK